MHAAVKVRCDLPPQGLLGGYDPSPGPLGLLGLRQRRGTAAELLLHPLTLYGVAHRSCEQPALDVPFEQVVLRAALDCLDAQGLVAQPSEHHDRHFRGLSVGCGQRFEALAVRQAEIEKDHVICLPTKPL